MANALIARKREITFHDAVAVKYSATAIVSARRSTGRMGTSMTVSLSTETLQKDQQPTMVTGYSAQEVERAWTVPIPTYHY